MPEIRTASRKPKLGEEWSYPLGVSDIEAALQPRQTSDLFLSVHFEPQQSWRKEERDRRQALGEYLVVSCLFSERTPATVTQPEADATWIQERSAPVVVATVRAIPKDALVHGVSLRGPLANLLAQGLDELAPRGIPKAPGPRDGWMLDLHLDARLHSLQANLRPWDGADFRSSRKLEFKLPPMQEKTRV